MPSLGPRRALITLAVGALLAGTAAGVRQLTVSRVQNAMAARGLRWSDRQDRWDGARWLDLERPGLHAQAVDLQLVPRPALRVDGAVIDLAQLPSPSSSGGDSATPLPSVTLRDASLNLAGTTLASELSGSLLPTLDVQGPGVSIHKDTDGITVIEAEQDLSIGPMTGHCQLEIRQGTPVTAWLDCPAVTASHPLLARHPLPRAPLQAQARWAPDTHALQAELRLGQIAATLSGTLDLPRWDLQLQVHDTDLANVLALFGDQVPEARRAQVVGMVGLDLDTSGPPLRWSATPRAQGLGADGAIPDPTRLRRGPLTWRAPTPDGHWTARTTGEGTEPWVPLTEAGLMPEAVMAAEDSAFWSHPGYDLDAIQQALDQAAAGEPLRGGSTLTQQLAKNLFLDGERTVARKLRELLYALELERRLGKERVLELYLNVVEFGPEVYGIGPAADTYFLKRPDHLSPREAAFLAAILPAPRTGYERALMGDRPPNARIDAVLDNMADGGVIGPSTLSRAHRAPLRFVPPRR